MFCFAAVFQVDAFPRVIPETAKVCEGDTAVLTCLLSATDEDPSWYHRTETARGILTNNGLLLDGLDKMKYGVYHNKNSLVLKIYNASDADSGNFTCRYLNHTSHSTAQLIVYFYLF